MTSHAGSYGLPVRDRRTGEITILTAAHVIGGLFPWPTSETAVVGYGEVHADDEHDTATAPLAAMTSSLGRLERSVPPAMTTECLVDAAIARVVSDRELLNTIDGRPISGVLDIRDLLDVYIDVRMVGARSNRREGILHTARVAERIRVARSNNYVFYRHGCLIRASDGPFAAPGDSGSIVVDTENRAVAMVVGLFNDGEPDAPAALAVPIAAVLQELDVDLFHEPVVRTVPVSFG
ncbi:MAG: hypothetical protein ACLP8S_19765 [Solirubrobacteraceae bacterium]